MKMIAKIHDNDLVILGAQDASRKIDNDVAITCAYTGAANILIKQDPSWKLVPNMLTSENTDIATTEMFDTPPVKFYCINANTDNEVKKRLIEFINWLATDEGIIKAWFGEEDETYKLRNNKIESIFPGILSVDCMAGVVLDGGLDGQKDFYNYALGRPFFLASPQWRNYQGKETAVYTETVEVMKNARTIEEIDENDIGVLAKDNVKYINIYKDIVNCETQFLKNMRSTNWQDLDQEYQLFIKDIERKGINELMEFINN